jgi:hypothetical protein
MRHLFHRKDNIHSFNSKRNHNIAQKETSSGGRVVDKDKPESHKKAESHAALKSSTESKQQLKPIPRD